MWVFSTPVFHFPHIFGRSQMVRAPKWPHVHPGCMGRQPWWADKAQTMASRCPKLLKRGQTPARTLRVKSRRRKGHVGMERSHGSPKCFCSEMGCEWYEEHQCGLRKGEMKSGIALQASADNAEGHGNKFQVCTALIREGKWKWYWRDAT